MKCFNLKKVTAIFGFCLLQPNTSYVPLSRAEFKWLPVQNVTSLDVCRNSQQGSTLAVDELGEARVVWN